MRMMPSPMFGKQAGAAAFDPASLFTGSIAGAWYDPSDLSSLFQDSAGTTPVTATGQPVGKMNDKSGNGNHLIQATAGSRPTYTVAGGLSYLLFDGVDDTLKCDTGPTVVQPWERVSGLRQVTWVDSTWPYGNAANNIGVLAQGEGAASPGLGIYDGTAVLSTLDLAVGADGVVEELHAGASSRIRINSGSYATGNTGSTNPPSSFHIGASAGSRFANVRLYGLIMRGQMTAQQLSDARTWCAGKSGVTL